MSEASNSLPASIDRVQVGPNYFGFYTRELVDLLSQDDDSVPATSKASESTRKKCRGDASCNGTVTVSSFRNSIGAGFSDFRKERLKSLLRQGVVDLTPEVDEMLDPVLGMCRLQSQIRNRKCSSTLIGAAPEDEAEQVRHKKHKTLPCSSSATPIKLGSCREGAVSNGIHVSDKEEFKKYCDHCHCQKTSRRTSLEGPKFLCDDCRSSFVKENDLHSDSSIYADKEIGEVDGDLQFLLESDSSEVDEIVKKYSDELYATLGHMERQLEELLNAVASRCRPMTRAEKHELRKLIQKLPQNNLDRVVEILQHNKLADSRTSDELFVDLEKEDDVTLWRLYYYVKAVETARKLL